MSEPATENAEPTPDTIAEAGDSSAASNADERVRDFREDSTVDFTNPDSLVGQTLEGRFFIEKNLKDSGGDAGGIGVVYLARDTKLMGKDVVVKILNEEALKHPDIIRKFEHEKEALVRLDHPGIVKILDSGTLRDGNPFIVMEHIKGHSLRRAIQLAGRLPLDLAASITESVTDALSAAHEAKILHRDIKPENIMLTPIEEGMYRVRLIDFGIARVEESKAAPETEIARAIGSIHYISPEQLIGRMDLTPAGDIFSMGVVVYEMVTGEVPFKPQTFAEMYKLVLDGVKTPPSVLRPEMPREAERLLLTALEPEPARRPQKARPFGRLLAHQMKIDENDADRFFASIKTEFSTSPTEMQPPERPRPEVETVQRAGAVPSPHGIKRMLKWALPAAGLLVFFAVGAAYLSWDRTPAVAEPQPAAQQATLLPERQLTFYLMVQKMRNGKPFEAPFKSSGQVGVEKGYQFTINLIPDTDGYFYGFYYGLNERGMDEFSIVSPTPDKKNGDARVKAGQLLTTTAIEIDGTRGNEALWVIWTREKNEQLEAIVRSAFSTQGDLNAESELALQAFLNKDRPDPAQASFDQPNQQTVIKARGEAVVHRFDLEHR